VLKQLQGTRVSVATATRSATGSVLTVEERTSKADPKDHPIVTRAVLSRHSRNSACRYTDLSPWSDRYVSNASSRCTDYNQVL
jgi:hypothetical protein